MDLMDLFEPPEDSMFYLIDSLRPFHVNNVYDGQQIKIIVLPSELDNEQKDVPEFEDIFTHEEEKIDEEDGDKEESESADDEDSVDRDIHRRKRQRRSPEFYENNLKRREWKNKR